MTTPAQPLSKQLDTVKTALVTGGTGGIGGAITAHLAELGYRVYANYHPAYAEQATQWLNQQDAKADSIKLLAADVTEQDQVSAMYEEISAAGDSLSVLVNCAGVIRDATLMKMTAEQWQVVINTNLNAAFSVTKPALEMMNAQKYGRIINISSVNGQTGAFGQTNYAAAKAGIHGFTMSLAQEVAHKGITVNSIAPGLIRTAMTASIPADYRQEIVSMIPLQCMGEPDDIANAVAFLCAPQSGYITGINLPVNGGLFMSA